ncbi:hypothetical protein HYZ99_01695 [Candidatus Peregrinibacteria bacterium]|nr:hypothetical protein [Candidatus Peregrinibacteria bacterium]
MVDVLPAGGFKARSETPLPTEQVLSLLREAVNRVVPETEQKLEVVVRIVARMAATLNGVRQIASINSWAHLLSAHFDKGCDKQEHPESAEFIDGICHVLRGRIALELHPEKIAELVDMLRSHGLQQWNVNTFRRLGRESFKNWFSNVRAQDGTIDWAIITERVNQVYPCQFIFQAHRENFTKRTALSRARELADSAVAEKDHWHPAADLEGQDKRLYMFLISLPEFRRKGRRPDIDHRKDNRPNWTKIAEEMGPLYQATMVISRKGHEIIYRDFDDAIDELGDLLEDVNPDSWTITFIERNNSNLYAWFKNHCRDEQGTVDIDRIVNALPLPWQERLRRIE